MISVSYASPHGFPKGQQVSLLGLFADIDVFISCGSSRLESAIWPRSITVTLFSSASTAFLSPACNNRLTDF